MGAAQFPATTSHTSMKPKFRIEYTAAVTDTETGAVIASQTLDCHVSGQSAVHEAAKNLGSTFVTALSYTLTKDTIIGIDGDKKHKEHKEHKEGKQA